jgi:carboxyl-terminal processing protease
MSRYLTSLIFCLTLGCTLFSNCFAVAADEETDKRREQYELMKLFVETFDQIESNYVQDIDRRELMDAAIQGMVQHLDQYSSYIPPSDLRQFDQVMEQEFGGIGISVNARGGTLTVVSPLPGTPAYRAGIRAGDIIVEVEGQSTEEFSLNDAVKLLQGPAGRPVKLKILHPGENREPEELEIVREIIQVPTVLGDAYNDQNQWNFMYDSDHKIGYVRVSHFSRHTPEELRAAITSLIENDMQGLVLDLRSNPGGLLEAAIEIADMFLEEGEIVSVRGRSGPERSWSAKKGNTFRDFPMAILVNRFSASASEVLSACLQDNKRAVVIGERTWGKGSVQNVIKIEAGSSALKLTTANYYRPSGVNIHRGKDTPEDGEWGVKPDDGYEVRFTADQFRLYGVDRRSRDVLVENTATPASQFEDTQLQKALEYINDSLSEQAE